MIPRSRWRLARVSALVVSAVVLVALLIWPLFFVGRQLVCPMSGTEPVRPGGSLSLVMLALNVAAFWAGHFLGQQVEGSLLLGQRAAARPPAGRLAVILFGSLIFLLLLAILLLVYETVALQIHGQAWPITYYVRCAIDLWPWGTLLAGAGSLALSFLLGHWLWYPRREVP